MMTKKSKNMFLVTLNLVALGSGIVLFSPYAMGRGGQCRPLGVDPVMVEVAPNVRLANEHNMEALYASLSKGTKGNLTPEKVARHFQEKPPQGAEIHYIWSDGSKGRRRSRVDKVMPGSPEDRAILRYAIIFPDGVPMNELRGMWGYATGLFETLARTLDPKDEFELLRKVANKHKVAIVIAPSRGHGIAYVANQLNKDRAAKTKASKKSKVNSSTSQRFTFNILDWLEISSTIIDMFTLPKKETRFTPEVLRGDFVSIFSDAMTVIKERAADQGVTLSTDFRITYANLSYGGWLFSQLLANDQSARSLHLELVDRHPLLGRFPLEDIKVSPGISPTIDLSIGVMARLMAQQLQKILNMFPENLGDQVVHQKLVEALELFHSDLMKDKYRRESVLKLVTGILEKNTADGILNYPKNSEVLLVLSGADVVVGPAQYYEAVNRVMTNRPDIDLKVVVLDGVKHQSTALPVWEGRDAQLDIATNLKAQIKEYKKNNKSEDQRIFVLRQTGVNKAEFAPMEPSEFKDWAKTAQTEWWSFLRNRLEAKSTTTVEKMGWVLLLSQIEANSKMNTDLSDILESLTETPTD